MEALVGLQVKEVMDLEVQDLEVQDLEELLYTEDVAQQLLAPHRLCAFGLCANVLPLDILLSAVLVSQLRSQRTCWFPLLKQLIIMPIPEIHAAEVKFASEEASAIK